MATTMRVHDHSKSISSHLIWEPAANCVREQLNLQGAWAWESLCAAQDADGYTYTYRYRDADANAVAIADKVGSSQVATVCAINSMSSGDKETKDRHGQMPHDQHAKSL